MSTAPEPRKDQDLESLTEDLIVEARRPILIERHRRLVEEMESSLGESMVTGETDHPRLRAMLAELDTDSEQRRVLTTLQTLAGDHHYKNATLRQTLVEHLCLQREAGGVEFATMQLHVIGIYRTVRVSVMKRQGDAPGLAELRELPASMLGRLLKPLEARFGTVALAESVVYTPAFAERCLRAIKRLRRPEDADAHWEDANGEPALSREQEEPLAALDEKERKATRQLLIRDRIRSQFFREVFLRFLSRDELEPSEVEAHPTVLHWLQNVEATAHLYPFLQGQTQSQKALRLSHLVQKIVQLHEMYARVHQASEHPSYREAFASIDTRKRLALMSRDHYPMLTLTPELTLAAMLCPFAVFVAWVQERAESSDFVLPPDPRR